MTDAFAGLVDPIIQHVIDLRDAFRRDEHPSTDSVKRGLIKVFQEAEGRTAVAKATDFALAKYALVYWADEVLIRSPWRSASSWSNTILERHYWGTRLAGEDFWQKAKQAETRALAGGRSPRNTDPLEVFFLCAALGFQGELIQDLAELESWATQTGAIIRDGAADPLPRVQTVRSPGGLGELRGDRMLTGVSWLVSATAVLTILGFIIAIHHRGT